MLKTVSGVSAVNGSSVYLWIEWYEKYWSAVRRHLKKLSMALSDGRSPAATKVSFASCPERRFEGSGAMGRG